MRSCAGCVLDAPFNVRLELVRAGRWAYVGHPDESGQAQGVRYGSAGAGLGVLVVKTTACSPLTDLRPVKGRAHAARIKDRFLTGAARITDRFLTGAALFKTSGILRLRSGQAQTGRYILNPEPCVN